jgi:hypothetical protein
MAFIFRLGPAASSALAALACWFNNQPVSIKLVSIHFLSGTICIVLIVVFNESITIFHVNVADFAILLEYVL